MRGRLFVAFAISMLGTRAHAANPQMCNVVVDITDNDPKGTNVHATPGGAILAALKSSGDAWIEVHVTGQERDWYRIDRANLIDPGGSAEERVIFRGPGWLHQSVLGVSGLQGGSAIYRDHDAKGPLLDAHPSGDEPVTLLGCWGEFLKVRSKKGVGWTREACTNMVTTCV
ncbi:MAG TPA: hypothetical protein VGI20_15340 [Rhizomicrobium sp.]|jgi:hypothetical protein